jgi:LPXTG-motif cell wall-anchored protein
MKYLRSFALTAFAGLFMVSLAPTARADQWNKKTVMTVTEAIELPSCCTPDHTVTLQPGEYVMVLVDSLSDRHIVRVFDKTQTQVITTILAIPNYRLQVTGNTVFQYWEVPAGQPKAMRAWFYPGDNFGQEFAYHKRTAEQIATYVKAPVPAIVVDTVVADDLKTAPLAAVDETGKATELAQATPPQPAAQPAVVVEPVQVASREEPAAAAPQAALPSTASSMPLLGLVGLVSLGVFAALGFSSRRRRLCRV